MATGFTNQIIDSLATIVDGLGGTRSDKLVKDVRKYNATVFDGSPGVAIYLLNMAPDYASTGHTIRRYSFIISINVKTTQIGFEEASNIARDVQDEILDAIDDSNRLDGLVLSLDPSIIDDSESPELEEIEFANIILQIDCGKIVERSVDI